MATGMVLLFMLVAIFTMAGVRHLLVWMRTAAAREHFWFGSGSLAAASALAAYCAAYREVPVSGLLVAQRVSISFSVVWLIAMAWFTVEYAGGNDRRRRTTMLVTLLFACVLAGVLFVLATGGPTPLQDPLGLLNTVALVLLAGLVADGSVRLWRSAQRVRAVTLGGGVGIALIAFGLHGALLEGGLAQLPTATPYAFLIAVVMMAYELAGDATDARAVSQRQRQELAHASRLAIVGELTASIAHEINQPLGAILSNADAGEILLENPNPPLHEVRQILADIRRDGLRASDVIRHVRTLVRNREFALEKLDANDVATDVIGLLDPDAHRRAMTLESALLPTPAYMRGDRAHMEQVLLNLMLNAMDATDTADRVPAARPPIVLGVSRTAHGEIEFRIVDAGSGIPAEYLSRLFDSFHTSKPHGMGLGLSIARSIVEAHGGRIRAENNPEAGATFRVTLPPYDSVEDPS